MLVARAQKGVVKKAQRKVERCAAFTSLSYRWKPSCAASLIC
ncbi:hypothetical protein SAMN04489714_0054 [Schaalia radingae]|uniref:Uncharacterized protein n=1 Tax=Schaalia radingae TaxID=131110 RepID=A0ABY0V4T6_9ACTO|nr:hypothetical protein SAMN04489714_0054 [Schaalia radingae]